MIAMKTIHYGIRLALVLIVVSLFYLSVVALFHKGIQLNILYRASVGVVRVAKSYHGNSGYGRARTPYRV